jgi:pyrophosphatase PpaX
MYTSIKKNDSTFSLPDFAVIFDFDGVIIHSKELQQRALLESYRLFFPQSEPCYDEFFSHSGDSLSNIFHKMGLPAGMIEPYKAVCRKNIQDIKLFHGMDDLLDLLNRTNFTCGLCTGKDRLRTLEVLDYFNLNHHFQVVICCDDVEHPKPHPESLFSAMKSMFVTADRMVMVGDARNDIECAKRAGVKSIGVSWGEYPFNLEEEGAPDIIVHTIEELKNAILQCPALVSRASL